MQTKYDLSALGTDVVYVKAVPVETLPPEVREQAGDLQVIFAVHDSEGTRLALVSDRQMAFHLARKHDKVPMTAH